MPSRKCKESSRKELLPVLVQFFGNNVTQPCGCLLFFIIVMHNNPNQRLTAPAAGAPAAAPAAGTPVQLHYSTFINHHSLFFYTYTFTAGVRVLVLMISCGRIQLL